MQLQLEQCPSCQLDLSKILDAMENETLTFCPKCQFPLVRIAGKYKLERVLRKGGCSIVYLASHVHLDRDPERVIKIIRPEFFTIKGMATRFRREVQITSALSQRNEHIVRIFDDFGDIPNIGHFYVMEYLQGSPLSSMLQDPALLPSLSFCFHLFMQLCEAVQFAHDAGVVHRDLKPDNLMFVKRKRDPYFLKVLDFGIAKPMSNEELPGTQITQGSLGTPAYMAPEQCLNQPTDARTDIYAMGVILYELLTGRTPFLPPAGEHSAYTSVVGVIEGQITKPPPSPHELRPDRVTLGLEKIILKALAKRPTERFTSVDDFHEAFIEEVNSMSAFAKAGAFLVDKSKAVEAFPEKVPEALSTAELEKAFMEMSLDDFRQAPERLSKAPSTEPKPTLLYGRQILEEKSSTSPKKAKASPITANSQLSDAALSLGKDKESDPILVLSQKTSGTKRNKPVAEISATEHATTDASIPAQKENVAPSSDSQPILLTNLKRTSSPKTSPEPTVSDSNNTEPDDSGILLDSRNQVTAVVPEEKEEKETQAPGSTSHSAVRQDTMAYSAFSSERLPGGSYLEAKSPTASPKSDELTSSPQPLPPQKVQETSLREIQKQKKQEEPEKDSVSVMGLVDRVQGPRDGLVRLFLTQLEDWDVDLMRLKTLQETVALLKSFTESHSFRSLYPGCRVKIILESPTFPKEVVEHMMREDIELRVLPRASQAPVSVVSEAGSHQKNKQKQSSGKKKNPRTKQVNKTAPVAKTANKTPLSVVKGPSNGHAHNANNSPTLLPMTQPPQQGGLQQSVTVLPPVPVFQPTLPIQTKETTSPPQESSLPQVPTPVAIWGGTDNYDPVILTPNQWFSPGLLISGFVLLFGLVGVVYATFGMEKIEDPGRHLKIIQPENVSSVQQPKESYRQVSLRPDRATFTLIPVQDRNTGRTELFVLFAARENRRLLIYAPQDQSRILLRMKREPGTPVGEIGTIPVWSRDLMGQGRSPKSRTYVGRLERLQRRKNGPLELVLPDENRNINKIRGFIRAGIHFPLDSMILVVGQKPRQPKDHRSMVLWFSLLIACVGGAIAFSTYRQNQRAF